MSRPAQVLYLVLAPDFGGTRFGPFEGVEVSLGSEAGRNDLVLDPSLGVLPQHVKVLRPSEDELILAPTSYTAPVFLWRGAARRPEAVTAPTAVRPGDRFALVTPEGPRFTLELGPPPEQPGRSARGGKARRRLNAGAYAREARRQAWTAVLVTAPGQMAQRAWTFVSSGAILQPRYAFLALGMLGGYLWGGTASCRLKKARRATAQAESRLASCKQDLSFAEHMGDTRTATLPQLFAELLDSTSIGRALEDDDGLRAAVREAASNALARPHAWDWLLDPEDPRARAFGRWRERVEGEEALDAELVRVLPFVGAEPEIGRSEWSSTEDALGDDVCTRGPARLPYRQALHLGLAAQPDALVTGLESYREDPARREKALLETLRSAGEEELPESFTSDVAPFARGKRGCVFVEGPDERAEPAALLRVLVRQLGEQAPGLPPVEAASSTPARLARYFAADLPQLDLREPDAGLELSEGPVSAVLGGMGNKGQWVLRRTAETLARSVVLRCEASLAGGGDGLEEVLGELPDVVPCLVLDYRLRHD